MEKQALLCFAVYSNCYKQCYLPQNTLTNKKETKQKQRHNNNKRNSNILYLKIGTCKYKLHFSLESSNETWISFLFTALKRFLLGYLSISFNWLPNLNLCLLLLHEPCCHRGTSKTFIASFTWKAPQDKFRDPFR